MTKNASGPHIPWGIFSIVLIGTFLGPLGGIIVAVALPTIAKDFTIELSTAKWVLLVYQLATTFLLPVIGRLGQRFGEGRLFMFGFGMDALGTLGSALVPEGALWLLILTRIMQAVGSACLFALFSGLVTRVVPPAKRGLAFGIIGATVAVSLVVAPPLGGILCEQLGWRWVFLIQLPLHLLALWRGWRLLPRDPLGAAEPLPLASLAGWLALVSALVFSAEALERGWALQFLGLAALVAVAGLAALVSLEQRPPALFNYRLFGERAFLLGAAGMLALNLTFSVMILLIPFYLQDYLGFEPRRAGMLLCLSPLFTLLAAPLSGSLSDRIGPRVPALAAFVLGAAGFACIAGAGMHGNLPALGAGLALLGMAGGLFNGPIISAMMAVARPAERSEASSVNSLARNLGFVSGTALGSLLLALLTTTMPGQPIALAEFERAGALIFWLCGVLCAVLALLFAAYPDVRAVRAEPVTAVAE